MKTILSFCSLCLLSFACEKDVGISKNPSSDLVGFYSGDLRLDTVNSIEDYEVEVQRMDDYNVRVIGQNDLFGEMKFTVQKQKVRRIYEITSLDTWETDISLYAITEQHNLTLINQDGTFEYRGFRKN